MIKICSSCKTAYSPPPSGTYSLDGKETLVRCVKCIQKRIDAAIADGSYHVYI